MSKGTYTVDSLTGTKTFQGELELTKGNHNNMPSRNTPEYEPDPETGTTYERGHNNASSTGGTNDRDNISAQAKDVNHKGVYQLEAGERDALKDGATIQSEKIAYASNQIGQRPDAFMVNDTITYSDGHMTTVNHSFTNLSYAYQEQMNAYIDNHPVFNDDYPNPGDHLRDSMSTQEYSELMEITDAEMPGIRDSYDTVNYSYTPNNSFEEQFGVDEGCATDNVDLGEFDVVEANVADSTEVSVTDDNVEATVTDSVDVGSADVGDVGIGGSND